MSRLRLMLASSGLLMTAACATTEGPRISTGVVVSASGSPQVERLVNSARHERGLSSLASSPALTGAAVAQARYVASIGQMTHRSRGGATVKDRVEARGYDACLAAENLAARQPDAASVTAGWLSSPGHRNNMLLRQATHQGAAYADTEDGTRYWVQVFALHC